MARILFVSNFGSDTGYAWNNIYRLYNHLAESLQAHDVKCFLSFALPASAADFPAFEQPSLRFDPYDARPGNVAALLSFVQKHRIDGVYLTDQRPFRGLYFLLRCAGVRTVVVHSRVAIAGPDPVQPQGGLKGVLKFVAHRLPMMNASRLYAVSDHIRRRWINFHVPADRVVTILNGIDVHGFETKDDYENQGTIRIFVCGRARHEKGIDVLIRATARLKGKNIRVDYYGDGPCMDEYRQLVGELGIEDMFIFKGKVPSVRPYLHRYDIACVPSVYDAGPSAVSESFAAGVPLIASKAGGIPQQVGSSDNALLVEVGDSEDLARAIERLAADSELRRRLGQNGRKRAERRLSLRHYHDAVLNNFLVDFGIAPAGPQLEQETGK